MDPLHVHLFINHLPVFGTFLGLLILVLALWRKSAHTEIAAYLLFAVSSLGAVIAYLTGEGAEEVVENIPGIVKEAIEQHEEFSIYAFIALIILGIASIIGIILIQKRSRWIKKVSSAILALSIVSFGLMAWTSYLGGKIRHTEIKSATVNKHGNKPVKVVQLNSK